MQPTGIAWADYSWNPVLGCSKVSKGCQNCYAERLSLRQGWTDHPWTAEHAGENVTCREDKLDEPHTFDYPDGPGRVFVNSMSDLFHEEIPDSFITRVFARCATIPECVWIVLTKRPQRAAAFGGPWPSNLWMGTSVENAQVARRLDWLRDCDAETLWVSFEPLIGPVGDVDLTGFDWAVVGGETATPEDRRDMEHAWARSIRDQCAEQDTAFFFKQSSGRRPDTGRRLQEAEFRGGQKYEAFPPLPDVTRRAREDGGEWIA